MPPPVLNGAGRPSQFLSAIDPGLALPDQLVLCNLLREAYPSPPSPEASIDEYKATDHDLQTLNDLTVVSDPTKGQFQPAAFTSWESSDFPPWIRRYALQPYIAWASSIVRRRADVAFLTHILVLSIIGIPNFVLLFLHFSWYRAIFQWVLISYLFGPFSILMHNHIHGRGILSKQWASIVAIFPYILGPMMGQTWNSFYYHHKHHHMEENGPGDLSSTLRYQRDSAFHLACYLSRFVFWNWIELPLS